jgi:hypothetical protein
MHYSTNPLHLVKRTTSFSHLETNITISNLPTKTVSETTACISYKKTRKLSNHSPMYGRTLALKKTEQSA